MDKFQILLAIYNLRDQSGRLESDALRAALNIADFADITNALI